MDGLWESTKVELVPKITDELLRLMADQIRPLVMRDDGLWTIEPKEDVRGVSYLWDAKPAERIGGFDPLNHLEIITFHYFGAPSLFKPSIAEVMASIARFVPDWSRVRYFCLRSDDMGASNVIGDCHWCRCDLFGERTRA